MKRSQSFELTAVHSFLVLRMLYSQMGMQLSEKPILWRHFRMRSALTMLRAPHRRVGSVRLRPRYTPRSWRLEQEPQWPAWVTLYPASAAAASLLKLASQ